LADPGTAAPVAPTEGFVPPPEVMATFRAPLLDPMALPEPSRRFVFAVSGLVSLESMLARLEFAVAWFAAVAAPVGNGSEEAEIGCVACQNVPDTGTVWPEASTDRVPPSLVSIEEREEFPEVCKADVDAPAGSGSEAAETGCVDGKFVTETEPETGWVALVAVTLTFRDPPVALMAFPEESLIFTVPGGGVSASANRTVKASTRRTHAKIFIDTPLPFFLTAESCTRRGLPAD
jgi:hypothetical protein